MDDTNPQPGRWQRLLEWLHRYRYVLAPLSFGAGLASFVLIERREWLAQWISALLILGWILILAEEVAARRLRLAPGVLRFGIQAIQQETFFFTLPFLLHTTTWSTGQGVFTGMVVLAAACSIWDPLYFGRIATRPWLFLAFHGLAVFVGTLTVAPILLHLTTTQTLALASGSIVVLAVPTLSRVIDRQRPLHWLLLFGGAAALGGLAWLLRPWVPPATLWLHEGMVTEAVDEQQRVPGFARVSVSPAHLHAQGLYAFTAIRAPRGLHERVYHRWVHEGVEVDRIALELVGGRDQGYRVWSYKRGFPADPGGAWRVEAVTEGGQLIGRVEFIVIGELPGPASSAPAVIQPEGPPPEAPVEPVAPPGETPMEQPLETPAEPVPEEMPPAEPESGGI